ncbi:MAG: AMP-binding protein [Proteobacteria bacterium]|nr:AMP-binding protein [Pseudomonadota bacterium]
MANYLEMFDSERIGIANHARNKPGKAALIMDDIEITYGELDRIGNALANGLIRLGIKRGDRISVLMHNSPELIMVWSAAGKVGATPIALNYRFKSDELAYIINDSHSKVLVYGHEFMDVVAAAKSKTTVPTISYVCSGNKAASKDTNLRQLVDDGSDTQPSLEADSIGFPDSLIYTSGTTGKPKGVLKMSKARINGVLGLAHTFESTHDDTMLIVGPLYHSANLGWASMGMVLGNTVVIMPRFDSEEFLRLVQKHRVNTTFAVPTMFNRIVHLPAEVRNSYDTSSLRVITVAGEAFPFSLKKKVVECFGENKLFEFYGGTELTCVTYLRPEDQLAKPESCGKPAMESKIKILDGNRKEVPTGEVGILYVKNDFLLKEYNNNSSATKDNFHHGYFTIGDMAKVDEDGYYYIVDRAVDMVVSGGVNIYPAEIEEVLCSHPAVFDCAIIGVPDPEWGEKIVAYIVPEENGRIGEDEVKRYVGENLASYKKPKEVYFLENLPYLPSGKKLKRVLKKAYPGNWEANAK